jgi:hypothetical protein
VQLLPLVQELLSRFFVVWVSHAGIDRADFNASRRWVSTNALRALVWVNDIDGLTLADCLIWAFGFTSPTANTVISDFKGH